MVAGFMSHIIFQLALWHAIIQTLEYPCHISNGNGGECSNIVIGCRQKFVHFGSSTSKLRTQVSATASSTVQEANILGTRCTTLSMTLVYSANTSGRTSPDE